MLPLNHNILFIYLYGDLRELHSFPTRRSSDLHPRTTRRGPSSEDGAAFGRPCRRSGGYQLLPRVSGGSRDQYGSSEREDRKSTRLNSSHSQISYAVFCLKKKKI